MGSEFRQASESESGRRALRRCSLARARRRGTKSVWRASSQGFSLLELVVVVALIAILATIALDRLWALRVDAERVAMAQMLGTLRSALGMKVAEYLARGDLTGLRQLEGSNPVELLAEIPENYRGAWPGPEPGSIPGGSWYFDSTNGTLVYRVYHAEEFHSPLPGPPRARFRVEVLYGLHGEPQGARLAALEPYRWGPSAVPKGDENLSTAEKR